MVKYRAVILFGTFTISGIVSATVMFILSQNTSSTASSFHSINQKVQVASRNVKNVKKDIINKILHETLDSI